MNKRSPHIEVSQIKMSDLFGGDEGAPSSFFAARKATKKQQEVPKKQKESHKKHASKPKDTCVYQTPVTVQVANSPNGQLTRIENCQIGAFKSGDPSIGYLIKIIDNKRTNLASIPINIETTWRYNTPTQCSTYDSKHGQVIIDFPTEQATQILSIFAVHPKAKQYSGIFPLKIEGSVQNNSTPIHYLSIDVSSQSIRPVEVKDDFIPQQNSQQAEFANNNGTGSGGVVRVQGSVFAFILVQEGSFTKAEAAESEGYEEEEEVIIEEIYEDEPDQIDSQKVEEIQKDARNKLDQLALMMKALKPNPIPMGRVTVSNMALLRDIRCAITAAKLKDQEIERLQAQIDKFGDMMSQIHEKEEIKRTMSKISDEMLTLVEVADESESIQNKKREKIAELSKQIELHQKQLNMTDEQLLSEAYKEIEALKKKREELATKSQRQVEDGAAGTVFLQEQIAELTRENEELRVKNASLPTEEDLKREKEVIQAKLKEAVKDLRAGAIEMLQQNIDEENEYSGEIVKTAVNTILRRVSNKILGIEEPEEEPKQEEEEEEAEDPPAPEAEQEAENQNEEQEDENEGEQDGENEEDDHEEGGEGEEENGENEEENGEEDEGEAEEEGEE